MSTEQGIVFTIIGGHLSEFELSAEGLDQSVVFEKLSIETNCSSFICIRNSFVVLYSCFLRQNRFE